MAKRKRKLAWGPSNPLWRWQKAHGKLYKSEESRFTTGKSMAKKTKRSWFKKKCRRRKDRSIPLLPVAGVAYTVLFKPHPWAAGDDTPIKKLTEGNYPGFLNDLVTQAVSMTPDGKKFDAGIGFQFYLPIVAGVLGHWAMGKFGVNKYMHKIPMVGKYISL